ncbi:TPA_exp: Cytochrome c oxidase protein 20, mitochondrial [Trichophyton benhamiae CBS 112371]|uniref:Cytochrome c oxidase assembly protein COX20, mitochondrial n=1 Tax=Arthroderma benhamiae (strain ATCC MYA-4681 / CBS 112371) TaxID=663331 RepID=D4AYA6_ARTBC|nr:uncharacterized protein ARB_01175 [Trichophyton benhamiae CBS 112371]EFE31922.1 hypothetical protein ARB_01175 [Trichophyton benhamiae CBS 112371]DAA75034.1 TPA_exp: Cytochrome c oxidase protein 20, mitochondrial [Trichophyton benhamiae CBS 112371]
MAADSRDQASQAEAPTKAEPTTADGKTRYEISKSQVGKLWEELGNPKEPVNLMPGGTYNSAGGKPKEVTVMDSLRSLSLEKFASVYKAPCARDSLLLGIGTGFGVGGLRAILGGLKSLWSASNWAVGSFALVSLAAHEYCQRQRAIEREGMKEAAELMRELKLKKQKEREAARKLHEEEEARKAEEARRKSWTNLSNYKFW